MENSGEEIEGDIQIISLSSSTPTPTPSSSSSPPLQTTSLPTFPTTPTPTPSLSSSPSAPSTLSKDIPHPEDVFHDLSKPRAGFWSSTFNLTNCIIGGGVLAIPFAFKACGLVSGVSLCVFVAMMGIFTASLLKRMVISQPGINSFKDLGYHCFGRPGAIVIEVCVQAYLLGAITGYTVIIADVLSPFLFLILGDIDSDGNPHLNPPYTEKGIRNFISFVVILCIVYPLCLLRYIDKLSYASIGALVCVFYMVVLIVTHSIPNIVENNPNDGEVSAIHTGISFFRSFPIITFAFSFHIAFFAIYNEMENQKEIDLVVITSTLISCSGYLFVGIFGYLAFKDTVGRNILLNFDTNIFVQIAKISLAIVICFSYPLLHFPLRESEIALLYANSTTSIIERVWRRLRACVTGTPFQTVGEEEGGVVREGGEEGEREREGEREKEAEKEREDENQESGKEGDEEEGAPDCPPPTEQIIIYTSANLPQPPFILITTFNIALAYCLAVIIPDISSVFGLVGATSGCMIAFIFPCACFLKLERDTAPKSMVYFSYFVIILAIIFAIIGTLVTLGEMISGCLYLRHIIFNNIISFEL